MVQFSCLAVPYSLQPQGCSVPVHHQFLKLAQSHVHQVGDANHLILCRPLLLLLSILPSITVLSNESALGIKWSKYCSFNIGPFSEYSGLISFRMDWLDLLIVRGTLKIFSNTTVQKHQFFSALLSLWSSSHIHT